jgi:hypothetical protein
MANRSGARRVNTCVRVATALLVLLACGCGASEAVRSAVAGTTASPTTEPAVVSTTSTVPVAVVHAVDGIPAARFIAIARAAALGYSERHPWNIRVAIGSDHGAHALADRGGMTYNYGSTAPVYVLAFDGHFRCDASCADSTPEFAMPGSTRASTSTTVALPAPISTMVLTLDIRTLHEDGNFETVSHPIVMRSLGRVWQLAP